MKLNKIFGLLGIIVLGVILGGLVGRESKAATSSINGYVCEAYYSPALQKVGVVVNPSQACLSGSSIGYLYPDTVTYGNSTYYYTDSQMMSLLGMLAHHVAVNGKIRMNYDTSTLQILYVQFLSY